MLHRDILRGFIVCVLVAAFAIVTPSGRAQVDAQADEQPPGRVGRVAEFGGELFLASQDTPDQWVAIGLNYPVTTGDNLWVGKDSRAEIDFGGGQFRVSNDTNLYISRLDDRNLALYVAQGRVILRVRYFDAGDTARIDTPNAQIALTRPGLYRIDVSDDRAHTQLAVREGAAEVDSGVSVQQVLPGQSASLDGTTPQSAALRSGVGSDDFDIWSATRDRRYERGYANAPVSRQMVGQADLDDYGTWDSAPEYGAVWYPANVAPDWAPYQNGYWTDVGAWGPTWVDAAPWGYAPFHYGRWAHIHGRWGWCPGRYVARPVWAPALVGWVGGPGWRISTGIGGPVYGWVPLGWGEPFHPRWRGCSDGCWARYNAPYAVNVARRNDAPPTRFVNATAPGAVTAVPSSAFADRKPVAASRVAIPAGALASAPPLAAPPVRPGMQSVAVYKPGNGIPPPASATYASTPRQQRNVTPGAAALGTTAGVPLTRPAAGLVAPAPQTPVVRPQPVLSQPTVSTNQQPAPRIVPGNSIPSANPNSAPPTRTEARPAMQPAPQPQAVPPPPAAPTMQRGGSAIGPVPYASPQPRPAAPAPAQIAPAGVPQAPTPVPAPVQRVAPATAAGNANDAPKVEKPAGPVMRVPIDQVAK